MPTAKLFVRDLRSASDERRLEDALARVDGVLAALASCRDACVEIDFEDDQVTVGEIVAAAAAAGFAAELAG